MKKLTKKLTKRKPLSNFITKSLITLLSTALITTGLTSNVLAQPNGYYANGTEYLMTDVATHPELIQTINNAMSSNPSSFAIDLNGRRANYGTFISSLNGGTASLDSFTTYATQHPFQVPTGSTVYNVADPTKPINNDDITSSSNDLIKNVTLTVDPIGIATFNVTTDVTVTSLKLYKGDTTSGTLISTISIKNGSASNTLVGITKGLNYTLVPYVGTEAKTDSELIVTTTDSTNNTATVLSIDPISISTTVGTVPVLPTTVNVKMSDNTTKTVNVTWDSIDSSKYASAGNFSVNGTISESSIKAVANVSVSSNNDTLQAIGVSSNSLLPQYSNLNSVPTTSSFNGVVGDHERIYAGAYNQNGIIIAPASGNQFDGYALAYDIIAPSGTYIDSLGIYMLPTDVVHGKISEIKAKYTQKGGFVINALYYTDGTVCYSDGTLTTAKTGPTDFNPLMAGSSSYDGSGQVKFYINSNSSSNVSGSVKVIISAYSNTNVSEGSATGIMTGNFTVSSVPTISSIADINATINQGDNYSLPSTVTATMSDGTTKQVNVNWSNISQSQNVTSSTVIGKSDPSLEKDIIKKQQELSSNSLDSGLSDIESQFNTKLSSLKNVKPQTTVSNSLSIDTSKVGVYTFYGNVDGYSKQVKLTLTINVVNILGNMTDSQFKTYLNNNFGSLTIDGTTVNFNWTVNMIKVNGYDEEILTIINSNQLTTWLSWELSYKQSDIKVFMNKVSNAIMQNYPEKSFEEGVVFEGYFYTYPSSFIHANISYDSLKNEWFVVDVRALLYSKDGKNVTAYVQ